MKITFKYKGFTLLESLLVLMCVIVSLIVPILGIKSWKEQTEISLFLNQLERRIQQTHQSAIIEGNDSSIDQLIQPQRFVFTYYHHGGHRQEIMEVKAPLKLRSSEKIEFLNKSGNIKEIRVIKLEDHLNKKVIEYQFQLGSGKVIRRERAL